MTKMEAEKTIIRKAKEMGLKAGHSDWDGSLFVRIDDATRYADFRIWERPDSENTDWDNGIYAGYFEVEAFISRMGESSPAELLRAAEQIRLAAEFVKACEGLDLSFRQEVVA